MKLERARIKMEFLVYFVAVVGMVYIFYIYIVYRYWYVDGLMLLVILFWVKEESQYEYEEEEYDDDEKLEDDSKECNRESLNG